MDTMWRAAFFFIFFFGDITRGKLIPPNIPSNLEECYNDSYILTKDNLLPMTVNTLISIIRKIEDSVSTSMDMRTLTPAIISTFRYDGIVRNPEIAPQPLVIPYAPKGTEFPLFQTLFQQVLPNIGSTIPNETLSYLERCTLHAMLSSSIDVWDRGDNDAPCNYNQKFSWNPRSPRDLSKARDAEVFDPEGLKPEGRIMNGHRGNYQQSNFGALESACPVENGIVYSKYGDVSPGIVLSGIYAGLNPQKSPARNLYMQPRNLKRKPTQPQAPNYPNYDRRPNAGYNRAQYDPSGSNNGFGFGAYPGGNPGYPSNNPGYPSNNPGYPSNNPGYPSNNPGYPSNNPGYPSNYPASGPNYGYGGLKEVEGKYAATLAGLLANAVILQAPESPQHSINLGGSGHWNSTVAPKYYFLSSYQKFMVTDARLRGGLDGLLMADSIQSWINAGRGNLKLSQILSMYYSQKGVFGSDIKACKRKGYLEKFTNDLEDQTYSMAEVLKDAVPSARIPDEYIHEFSYESIQSLRRYLPSMNDILCEYTNSSSPPAADLHVVVDCSWNFREISDILLGIAENLDLRKYGGNMTIVNAKDGTVMVDSAKSVSDLAIQFNMSLYTSKPMGLDLSKSLSMIRHRMKDKVDYDKIVNSPGGIARIVVFIPSTTTNIPDSDANVAKSIIQNFKENLPDIKFLYFVTGSASKWNQFAEQPADVIQYIIYSPVDPLITRIATVPRRIINPTCGRYWSGYWYNELSFNGYLDNGESHFYKISPNYFFRDANAKITISTDPMAPTLTICTSRSNANPLTNNSRSGDITCNQLTSGNRFTMEIPKDICSEVYYVSQCNPYYLSITNNQQNNQLVSTCTDRECRDPDMIKYTISHIGLSCYSGVSKIFSSPYLLILIIFVNFSNFKNFI